MDETTTNPPLSSSSSFLLDCLPAFHDDLIETSHDDDPSTEEGTKTSESNQKKKKNIQGNDDDEIRYDGRKPRWWKGLYGAYKLTPRQRQAYDEMLASHTIPTVSYGEFLNLPMIFPDHQEEVWLELGFGLGDNLLANAQRHPRTAMIGLEVHRPGVATTLKRIQDSIKTQQYWEGYTLFSPTTKASDEIVAVTPDNPYSNVRVRCCDGVKNLYKFADSSLSMILITFPDPWPKDSHKKFRVVQRHSVRDFYRVLKPNGRFCLATDHSVFYEWSQDVLDQESELFQPVELDRSYWLPVVSKYEQKGWDEGRTTSLACWESTKPKDNGES